jgi:hypothetical protein
MVINALCIFIPALSLSLPHNPHRFLPLPTDDHLETATSSVTTGSPVSDTEQFFTARQNTVVVHQTEADDPDGSNDEILLVAAVPRSPTGAAAAAAVGAVTAASAATGETSVGTPATGEAINTTATTIATAATTAAAITGTSAAAAAKATSSTPNAAMARTPKSSSSARAAAAAAAATTPSAAAHVLPTSFGPTEVSGLLQALKTSASVQRALEAMPPSCLSDLTLLPVDLLKCEACGGQLHEPCLLNCLHTVCLRDVKQSPDGNTAQCPVCR